MILRKSTTACARYAGLAVGALDAHLRRERANAIARATVTNRRSISR